MKTYTLEELKAAQAKGCRIEWLSLNYNWVTLKGVPEIINNDCLDTFRLHPADVWKARLPRLKEGAEWACDGNDMPNGVRPPVVGEVIAGFAMAKGETGFTRRPVPPEFLHPDELAKQPEAAPETEMTLHEQLIAAHRRIGIEHTEMQVQRDRALAAEARVKELESARRLRPIAEAGPVPEGAVRLWAWFCLLTDMWRFADYQIPLAAHFIDIYPPQQ